MAFNIYQAINNLNNFNDFFFFDVSILDNYNYKKKKGIASIMAQNCISTALTKLNNPRNEKSYKNFMAKAKTNWEKMGLDHVDFPSVRNRRIKKMAGEKATDSSLETFNKHSYYEFIDTMYSNTNFLGFLRPENLQKLIESDLDISVGILIEKYADFFTTDLKYELTFFIDLYFS
jgi:hypothetical protein